ncbi:filamentous hemagglutinin N-terminal domain-containing protein (plasmid) [Kovacikia minuta CCNUW1]|uniref:two-partner secretion domain-containing protein n=1 Tax=Kovacikia minuta TaxID=2931930 RepID=UPI001CCB1D5B|nr:filamentous hemagglutinin N-terminal domain-containing protein [Kovacikia minuta]UBF30376.1 filamentous hemagglutinin N-terminal domain-containing protein [Kovacikia minuta CCNUW1]
MIGSHQGLSCSADRKGHGGSNMNRSHFIAGVLTVGSLGALLWAQPIAAQVVPDNTLPVGERSQVTGNPTVQIDGGARRGSNLFHSFSQFSIPTGGSAVFNNAPTIANIFARITGNFISNIDGLIRANGTANLFLLNPNGILFGPNARLNIGGSFVASTANSIIFADNFQYSATNSQTTTLLTISVPVGLQVGANPGTITVQGNGYGLSVSVPVFSPLIRGNSTAGLQVPVGQTLALIGGNVAIAGGTLTADQGRIELGSVREGQVILSATNSGFAFDYQGVQRFGDIRLSRQALGDASGGGVIQVQGNQVSVVDGSLLLINNREAQTGGSIHVNAAQSLELSGTDLQATINGGLNSQTVGSGRGADITVSTQQLIAQGGARTAARSYGSGDAGNITVNASDSIQVIGFSSINPRLSSAIGSGPYGSGHGGMVTVSTRRLSLLAGGGVFAPTYGTGNGGTVTVNATEAVEIVGVTPVFSSSGVASNSLNAGDAGAITINTARLIVQNGGDTNSSSVATGNAGSVTINASEFVEISGTVPGNVPVPSNAGSAILVVPEPIRKIYNLPDRPSGNAGNVTINTPRLSISNGANIGVNNEGTGNAGTLRVNANSIVVDRGGSIAAATASGEGGNLDLNVRDVLLLRNNSQITASAGGNGNGGNIRIDAGSIVAVPGENSDIRANSVNARGGNVTINASGIFGLQFRPQDTPLSDITATGANSASSGTVQLNIERLDPASGLIALPITVVDSSHLIAQGCPANQGNSFVITGRGGLPPTPEQQLDDDAEWRDRRRLVVDGSGGHRDAEASSIFNSQLLIPNSPPHPHTPHPTPHTPIIEATGWQLTPVGEISLVANTAAPTVQNRLNQSVVCAGGESQRSLK